MLKGKVNQAQKNTGYKISLQSAENIRHWAIKERLLRNYHQINNQIDKIVIEYETTSIDKIAGKYHYSPILLLRAILIYKKYPFIAAIFTGKRNPKDHLSERDLEQYNLAFSIDIENNDDQQQIAERSHINEGLVVEYFRNLGIAVRTEEQLADFQTLTEGRPISTPDILFLEPVYINGTKINWIDVKDYVLTDISFIHKSNRKQADKYTQKWGPGAILYTKGIVNGIKLDNTMILDGTFLNKKIQYVTSV
jgi:hypothetical protein